MATYRGIKGFYIQTVSSEPSNPVAGQVWYNSTLGKIRAFKSGAGNWATGNASNTNHAYGACFGIQTAAVHAGGHTGSGYTADSETYDGTSWTEGNNMQDSRGAMRGTGTATAGLVAGGYSPPTVASSEEYDGTNWAEGNNIGTARWNTATGGTQTAGIQIAGYSPGTPGDSGHAEVEEYDGTSWTEVTNLPSQRYGVVYFGTQTAGVQVDDTEALHYDGTNWTEGGTAPAPLSVGGSCGTQTAGMAWVNVATMSYDGTSWTELNDTNFAVKEQGGAGTTEAALNSGGEGISPTAKVGNTEEWTDPFDQTVSFDTT